MPIAIANVELTNSFDQWRITTNQVIKALRDDVVTKEDFFVENILDSIEVKTQPLNLTALPTDPKTPSDTLQIRNLTGLSTDANLAKFANFKAGQKVRIYGARLNGGVYTEADTPVPPGVSRGTGFAGFTGGSTFSYKICQFDYSTGKISNSSTLVSLPNIDITNFNDINNVTIEITRTNVSYGILIYRRITGSQGVNTPDYNLITVLGPSDLTGITNEWIDYYDFDTVVWSKKNSRNEFTSSSDLIHFPITAPSYPAFGWVETEVKFVDTSLKRLTFVDTFLYENECVVSHDDTTLLQSAIDERVASGIKSIELPTKSYIVKGLIVPTNFAIIGNGSKTTLRKLSWSSGFASTGNRILKSNIIVTDFSLSNIVLDGNMQNQYLLSENVDAGSNYLVDVTGSVFRYENIKLSGAIGGGIKASDSTSISVISSFIVDSNLNDRDTFSPLDVDSSSDVVLSSNLFRNFSGPILASTLSTGSIVGNIVKNCGSGILVYGSTNLISSPNILMGPANEFLPTPDILNSSYDSVNIKLEPNMNFNSDVYVYQENGSTINLSANRATIFHRVDKLQKIQTTESLYGNEILISGNSPLQVVAGTDLANGQFRFFISSQNVNILLNDYSFQNLVALNSNHIGLVYRSVITEYVPSGNVHPTTALTAEVREIPTIYNISRTISANTVGVNSTTNTLKINNVFLNPDSSPNTYFRVGDPVYYNFPATNTAITGLTANTTYYVSFANNTDVALTSTYNGANIDLVEARVANPAESHSLNKTGYTVKITNATNIATGSRTRFLNHGGTPSLDAIVGTVTSFNTVTGICEIVFDPTINIVAAGSNGNITVENSYVLAKGRIL